MGGGRVAQRVPVEVAEPACALRSCLTVGDVGPRRPGDPPIVCERFSAYCPDGMPEPDLDLCQERGIARRTAEGLNITLDAVRVALKELETVLARLPDTKSDGGENA